MRVTRTTLVASAVVAGAATVVTTIPSSAAASWGTGARTHTATSTQQTVITGVRIGHHSTYDRLVFDLRGPLPGYDVRYVSTVQNDASGKTVSLLGAAKMRVVIRPTSTTTHAPQGTYTPGYPEVRQVKGAGDFEAVTSYGVGLTSRQAFRVFTLTSPNRLVVDVQLPH